MNKKIIILIIIYLLITGIVIFNLIENKIFETKNIVIIPITEKEKSTIDIKNEPIHGITVKDPENIETKIELKESEIKKEIIKKPIIFTCPNPTEEYGDMSLANIGQDFGLLDFSYIPKDLEELKSEYSSKINLCLVREAKYAFELMAENAKKEDIYIKASSAFRTYETQKILYENDLKNKETKTSDSVAKAGYSEHQLGTTIDITGSSINYISASNYFDNTPEDIWLKTNAYLYGFVQSYPYDKETITGYRYEPWHYRYVGKENAKNIKDLNITIKEFLNSI